MTFLVVAEGHKVIVFRSLSENSDGTSICRDDAKFDTLPEIYRSATYIIPVSFIFILKYTVRMRN
jgi:hypothetical protein